MKTANGNISSLQEIVNALKNKEMISSVTESDDAWTLKFANGSTVTISKVTSPVVGVKQDSDGIYYWTMDGKWLLDTKGNKMPVSGKDGKDGGGDKPVKYCMHILDVVSADNNSGEITFKVLPINIASESFAASGHEPRYDIGMTDNKGAYIQGWDPDADAFFGYTGIFRAEDPLNTDNTFSVPVWKLSDLQAWQGRSAFAVQLRLYQFQDFLIDGKDEYGHSVYSDFENELASPYTALYPNILEPIEMLPGAYVTGPDGDPVPVNGEEHQYLPYNVLCQDGTPKEPGYRTILNGVMPAFVINGKTVTAEEAYKRGIRFTARAFGGTVSAIPAQAWRTS